MSNSGRYALRGTDVKAASISAAVSFDIALDRRMLEILKRDVTPERLAEVEREAAELVLASGQFVRISESAGQ